MTWGNPTELSPGRREERGLPTEKKSGPRRLDGRLFGFTQRGRVQVSAGEKTSRVRSGTREKARLVVRRIGLEIRILDGGLGSPFNHRLFDRFGKARVRKRGSGNGSAREFKPLPRVD